MADGKIEHTVRCAVCGKKETITITDKKIPENWFYFGKVDVNSCKTEKYFLEPKDQKHPFSNYTKILNPCYDPTAKHVFVEYWECKRCNEKGEDNE